MNHCYNLVEFKFDLSMTSSILFKSRKWNQCHEKQIIGEIFLHVCDENQCKRPKSSHSIFFSVMHREGASGVVGNLPLAEQNPLAKSPCGLILSYIKSRNNTIHRAVLHCVTRSTLHDLVPKCMWLYFEKIILQNYH